MARARFALLALTTSTLLAPARAQDGARRGEPPAATTSATVAMESTASAVPLWQAFKRQHVRVSGKSTGSYNHARLAISNKTGKPLTVDVNASYLRPSTSSVQPLGIGLIQAGRGDTTIPLPPSGKEVVVEVLSVCMKSSASSPSESTSFALATEPAPGSIGTALRAWKEKPDLPQSDVQTIVWGGTPRAPEPPVEMSEVDVVRRVPCELPEHTTRVAVVNGIVFALAGGELKRARPGEELETTATAVEEILADGGAIHALCRSSPTARSVDTRERRPYVARWDVAAGCWTDEIELAAPARLLWARDDAAIVAEERSLVLVTGSSRRTLGRATDRVVATDPGAVILSRDARSCVVTTLDWRARKGEVTSATIDVPLEQVASVSGTLFGIGPRGALYRVDERGRAVRVPMNPTGTELLAGGTITCRAVARAGENVLLTTDRALMLLGTEGRPSELASLPGGQVEVDPATGQAWAWNGRTLQRCDAGRWIDVKFVETVRSRETVTTRERR
jgi:hypothetical protein